MGLFEIYNIRLTPDQWNVIREMCVDFSHEVAGTDRDYRDNFNDFQKWILSNKFYCDHLTVNDIKPSIH